jgi:hypothetical protein
LDPKNGNQYQIAVSNFPLLNFNRSATPSPIPQDYPELYQQPTIYFFQARISGSDE